MRLAVLFLHLAAVSLSCDAYCIHLIEYFSTTGHLKYYSAYYMYCSRATRQVLSSVLYYFVMSYSRHGTGPGGGTPLGVRQPAPAATPRAARVGNAPPAWGSRRCVPDARWPHHSPVPVLAGCTRWACTRRSPSAASASAAPSNSGLASGGTRYSPQSQGSHPHTAPPAAWNDAATENPGPLKMRSSLRSVCSTSESCF